MRASEPKFPVLLFIYGSQGGFYNIESVDLNPKICLFKRKLLSSTFLWLWLSGQRCMTFADCRLQTADCRLQTADRRLQTADCRLQTAAVCSLQYAVCSLQMSYTVRPAKKIVLRRWFEYVMESEQHFPVNAFS